MDNFVETPKNKTAGSSQNDEACGVWRHHPWRAVIVSSILLLVAGCRYFQVLLLLWQMTPLFCSRPHHKWAKQHVHVNSW